MKLLSKKPRKDQLKEVEEKPVQRNRTKKTPPPAYDKPRDPTRWLSLLFLLIFLFLSYLSWVAYGA